MVTFFCVLTLNNMQLNSLVGKKIYQKQGFLQDGRRVPLTGVVVSGNFVTQIKTSDKEGYNALQVGIGIKKKATKRERGHVAKALDSSSSPVKQANSSANASSLPRFFKEIRVDDLEGAVLGSELNVSEIFQPGNIVDVTGISKGKGFAGGVKRWGFHGGPKTHGQSDRHRAPGSIGQGTTPGRVYRGKKMAGRMGSDTVTLKNLEIIEVTSDGVLLIKGLVPGSINSIVVVKKVGENKKFVPLYKEVIEEQLEEKSGGQPSVSDDVQPSGNNLTSEPASLSENQLSDSSENQEQSLESTLGLSENEQSSSVSEIESKEEVHPSSEATEDK